ncbi:hypothetical protein [Paenibacillus sp. FSL R7-0331]|uniref:hypothetical protein n=1 Tax=Paenibacillus sp. FSL R7-0331 TaxID=1536773 RepID=UPI0004F5BFF5|nr:hypothetical protein [Paenibacillus sp. FSL R7-0331]AIQ53430.1 hypothetical protein R70331_19080 [Paenibacillus sp. FSL R7-0331]
MNKKLMLSVILTTFSVLCLSITVFAGTVGYSLRVNGADIKGEAKVIDGVTYIPLRTVVEGLKGSYNVIPESKTISILRRDISMYGGYDESNPLHLGSKAYFEINENYDKFIGSVSIKETSTGKEALKILKENKEPIPSGYTYLLLKIDLEILASEKSGASLSINNYRFEYIDPATLKRIPSFMFTKYLPSASEGQPFNGWVGFLIPEDHPSGMIVLSSSNDRQNALWMKVE